MEISMRIKKLLILFGTSLLISCATTELPNQEVCDVIMIKDTEICRCRWISSKTLEAITDPIDNPLKFCHGITGPRTKKLASEIIPHVRDAVNYCKDLEDQWEDNY